MAFFMRQQHDGASVASVAGIGDPGPNGSIETAITDRAYNFPNSRKVYVSRKLHPDIRVGFLSSRAKSRDLSIFL